MGPDCQNSVRHCVWQWPGYNQRQGGVAGTRAAPQAWSGSWRNWWPQLTGITRRESHASRRKSSPAGRHRPGLAMGAVPRSTHSRHSNAARSVGPWLTGLQDRLSRPRSHRRIGWRGEPSAFACLRIWPGGSFGFVRVRALEISILPTPKFVRLVTVRSRHRCRNLFACSSTWANHKHEVVAELCEVGVCEYRLPYTSLLSTLGVSLRSGCLLGI